MGKRCLAPGDYLGVLGHLGAAQAQGPHVARTMEILCGNPVPAALTKLQRISGRNAPNTQAHHDDLWRSNEHNIMLTGCYNRFGAAR